ncbi:MAG: hypothetical protein ACRBB0_15735, partial [Pelagimonas sp.]|uniref:hypothetical protein n=1 Tax=Pelagimonas sp. TaxID=2073170 RepID=UPI003D6B89A5
MIGNSVVVPVEAVQGETRLLGVLGGAGLCPVVGAVLHFARLNAVSVPARILGIEAAEDMAFQVTLVND